MPAPLRPAFLVLLPLAVPLAACDTSEPASAPRCGDGAVTAGATCDDGDTPHGDGCSNTCQRE